MSESKLSDSIWEKLWWERARAEAAVDESGMQRGTSENIRWISDLANLLEEYDVQDVEQLRRLLEEHQHMRYG